MPIDVLRPVAMVTVGVNDGDAIDAECIADEFDHDRFDIDATDPRAPWTTAHGVVARGAHQSEAPFNLLVQHCNGRGLGTAGTDQVGFGGHTPLVGNTKNAPGGCPSGLAKSGLISYNPIDI